VIPSADCCWRLRCTGSIAAHDFGAVARLLGVAVSLGLADTPAASQAAELLDRLALFAAASRGRQAERAFVQE
jgi:hypothetical protein